MIKKILSFILLIIFSVSAKSQKISLNEKWSFAIDLSNAGEQNGRYLPWEQAEANTNKIKL